MKWRSTAIYFLILLVAGGVYFGIRTKQNEAARKEKESKRIFTFNTKAVKEIEIKRQGAEALQLKKGHKKWKISQPIVSAVDTSAFGDFFGSLGKLERGRKIGKPSGSLKDFGLDKPSLVVRLLADGKWSELQMGAKNPTETARYAKVGKNEDVFLISNDTYFNLNKSLKDLRRKELFSWQPGQVKVVNVKWRNGDQFSVERQAGTKRWKSADKPDLKIKTSKVQNLLDSLQWIRAEDFLAKDAMPSSAQVDVTLQLKDGKTAELKIADAQPAKKSLVATSSEVVGPVQIPSTVLSSIPRSVNSLVNRSLISLHTDAIRKIAWKTTAGNGKLVWIDQNNWGTKEGSAAPKALKNPWRVSSFLAFMDNAEYIDTVKPGSSAPKEAPNSVRFVDVSGKKNSLTWDKLDPKNTGPVNVWLEGKGATQEVQVKHQDIKRLDDLLAKMEPKKKVKVKPAEKK